MKKAQLQPGLGNGRSLRMNRHAMSILRSVSDWLSGISWSMFIVYCFFLRFLTMARITKNSTTRARSTRMMTESWWLYLVMTEMSAA